MSLNKHFSSLLRSTTVFGISFFLVVCGLVNAVRYGTFVSALQQPEGLSGSSLEDVLAENDSIQDLLITFNYETAFEQPVEFFQDITAPNVLYSLSAGDGLRLTGDSQNPTISNTGVLSVNGQNGAVTIAAGENITLVEENGVLTIKSTDTDTDTKLSETEVEAYIFDGESTGEFSDLQIGDILLSDSGSSSTTSGSSLVGVYQGNLSVISGTNVQEIIDDIDSTIASLSTSSHAEVTFAGSLDYLTLTGQEITLNQIDLTTDVSGILPTGHIAGTYAGIIGVGTITSGTWQGSVISSTYLDTIVILSSEIDTYSELNTLVSDVTLTHNGLIDTSAEIAGIVGDETGSGALVFGTSPSLTTPNIGAATGTSLSVSGAITSGGIVTGTGSGLTGLNASNLSSGTLPDARLAGAYTGLTSVTGSGTATFGTFSGSGASLTSLNASNLSSGTVASARLSGSYTGITGLGTVTAGTWQGSVISATYLDPSLLASGDINTSAEVASIVTDETGSGALVFGTGPTFSGNVYFPGSGIWDSTGDVGIGTTNPGAALDVEGAAQFGSGNVDLINSTGKIAAINTTYFASVDGSALTNLNASNLASGTVASARISGSYTGITGTGALNAGSISSGFGNIDIGTSVFTGNGSGLTTLNASNLSSGTVASARISGSYTGITGLGTVTAGTWQGSVINASYLDGSLLTSTDIDTSAELATIVTNETGSGALVFGTSPTLTTPNIGAATGTSLSVSGAITSGGIVTGTGSGLSGLNASNLSSGTLPDARLTGTYTGLTSLTGSGTATFGTFSGSGAALTTLNATNLSSGTVASARISGSYTGVTGTGALNAGSISSGFGNINIGTSVFTGNGSGLTTLNASNLSSGTVADARITGSYTGLTNLTGSGSSTFGSFILSSNGTAASPAIRWSADTNMGLYRIGTDIVGISTAGTERLRVDASGNIGIGTTSGSSTRLTMLNTGGAGMYVNSQYTGLSVNTTGTSTYGVYVNTTNANSVSLGIQSKGNAIIAQTDHSAYAAAYFENTNTGSALAATANSGYGAVFQSSSNYAEYSYRDQTSSVVARFENASNYCQVVPGGTGFTCPSDIRLKKDISSIDSALDKIMALQGIYYHWKTDTYSDPKELGFIAQEVEKIVPELIYNDPDTGIKSMGYGNLTPLLVNAMHEQQLMIGGIQDNIASVNIQLTETGEVLSALEMENNDLSSTQVDLLARLDIDRGISDERSASMSATLQTMQDRIDSIEKMTNDTEAVIAGLQDRVSQLESLFVMQTATDAATIAGNTGDVLGAYDELDLGSLTVTGDTNVNNLGITGDITAGLLSIKGFDDELATPSAIISTISGPLKIQDQAAGNLEIMGGKVLIDTDGNIIVRGSVTVDKLNVDETDEGKKSIGEGTILQGENTAVIYTTSVTEKSKIFLIVRGELMPITVIEKKPGESFTVKIDVADKGDISFDWWVVN